MEKENGVPLPRRRPAGSDGPAPTALATQGESASDDPAGGDTGAGQDEEELGGGRVTGRDRQPRSRGRSCPPLSSSGCAPPPKPSSGWSSAPRKRPGSPR